MRYLLLFLCLTCSAQQQMMLNPGVATVPVASLATNLSTGLIAYYRFEDGAGVNATDATGNGRTLSQHGSPPQRTGKLNNCDGYNGSTTYFDRADESAMRFTGDFTIGCWIWLTNLASNFEIQ